MKLKLVIGLIIGAVGLSQAALITRPYTYSTGNTITASENNSNENTLYTEINGLLDSANIEDGTITGADIAATTILPANIDTTQAFTFSSATISAANITIDTTFDGGLNKLTNVSTGTAYNDVGIVGQISSTTVWVQYTPTFTGLGSVSNTSAFWRRVGDTIEVRGKVTAGTVSANALSITLPNSYTIHTSKLTASVPIGWGFGGSSGLTFGAGDTAGAIFYDGSDNTVVFVGRTMTTVMVKVNGNALLGTSNVLFTFFFSFPATGLGIN